jgi:hypothetical protein
MRVTFDKDGQALFHANYDQPEFLAAEAAMSTESTYAEAAIDAIGELTDDINRHLEEIMEERYGSFAPQGELVALAMNFAAIIYSITAGQKAEEARSLLGLVNELLAVSLEDVIENPDTLNVTRVFARLAARDKERLVGLIPTSQVRRHN